VKQTFCADEIICHPFFLSPLGRHVSQDIPAIVDEAIRVQGIQVPVSTTKALGSSTDLMLHAIHFLVQENSSTLLRLSKKLN
jgi:sirohydrochlorin ferrochelatase